MFEEQVGWLSQAASTMHAKRCLRRKVVRTSSVKPFATQLAFVCALCSREQVIHLTDGKYQTPTRCRTASCRSKNFVLDRGADSKTQTIDWQRIR